MKRINRAVGKKINSPDTDFPARRQPSAAVPELELNAAVLIRLCVSVPDYELSASALIKLCTAAVPVRLCAVVPDYELWLE